MVVSPMRRVLQEREARPCLRRRESLAKMTVAKSDALALYVGAAIRWLAYHGKKAVTIDDIYGVYEILVRRRDKESIAAVKGAIRRNRQNWNIHTIRNGGTVIRHNTKSVVTLYLLPDTLA